MKLIKAAALHSITGSQRIQLPAAAKILSAIYKRSGSVIITYEADNNALLTERTFYIYGVGDPVDDRGNFTTPVLETGSDLYLYEIV